MKINWEVRLKNKTWLLSMSALILSFVYGVLDALGVVPDISKERVTVIIQSVLTFLGLIGVVQDPTTAGLTDSDRAMSYTEPWSDKPPDDEGENG